MSFLPNFHGFTKPPAGSRIDMGSPLTDDLRYVIGLEEGDGGYTYDAVAMHRGALTNSAKWATGTFGRALDTPGNSGASDSYVNFLEGGLWMPRLDMSLFHVFRIRSAGTFPNLIRFTGAGQDGLHSACSNGSGADMKLCFVLSTIASLNPNYTLVAGHAYAVGMSYHRQQSCDFYIKDLTTGVVTLANVVNTSTPAVVTGTPTLLAAHNTTNNNTTLDGQVWLVYVWSRALSSAEWLQLVTDPYCLYAPPLASRFIASSAHTPLRSGVRMRKPKLYQERQAGAIKDL